MKELPLAIVLVHSSNLGALAHVIAVADHARGLRGDAVIWCREPSKEEHAVVMETLSWLPEEERIELIGEKV